jgi:hypothetical protein
VLAGGVTFRAKFHSKSLYSVEKKIVGILQYAYFRLRPFLENIYLEKFIEKNNFLEKFEKKNPNPNWFFYTFVILTTKMTTKMYIQLASIEINDKILSKVGGIRKNLGENF